MYSAPFSVNFCPEVFTKPVGVGIGVVGDVGDVRDVGGGEIGEVGDVGGGVVAAPGRHW